MTTENEVQNTEAPKDIGAILNGEQQPAEQQAPVQERSNQPDSQNEYEPWTYAAMRTERTKRQAMQKRVQELEAENRALVEAQSYQSQEAYDSGPTDFFQNPDAYLGFHRAETNLRASKAEYIAENGRQAFNELEAAVGKAMQAGDQDVLLLRERMMGSSDPVSEVADWYESYGRKYSSPSKPVVFPSNLAGARSVGRRNGPGWNGPTPLNDIFAQAREKNR